MGKLCLFASAVLKVLHLACEPALLIVALLINFSIVSGTILALAIAGLLGSV